MESFTDSLNTLLLLAALGGALLAIILYFWTGKNKSMSWLMSAVIGILVVLFLFPDPEIAKNLAGVFNNYSLVVQKLIWVVSWGGAAYLVLLLF